MIKQPLSAKLIFLQIFIVIIALGSCSRKNEPIPDKNTNLHEAPPAVMAASSSTKASSATLSVKLNSSSVLANGQTFSFTITVMKGSSPAANVQVNIDDPVAKFCAVGQTDSKGNYTYKRSLSSSVTPGFYQFRFYLPGTVGTVSMVAIKHTQAGMLLPNTTMALNIISATSMSTNQMFFAKRMLPIASDITKTNLKYISGTFTTDLFNEMKKSKLNVGVFALALVTCPLPFVPLATPTCVASVSFLTTNASISSGKLIVNNLIDQSGMSSADKRTYKAVVESTAIAINIGLLKIDQGPTVFKVAELLSITYDADKIIPTIDPGSSPKGLTFTALIKSGAFKGQTLVLTANKK